MNKDLRGFPPKPDSNERVVRDHGIAEVYAVDVIHDLAMSPKKLVEIQTDKGEIRDVVDDVEIYADVDSVSTHGDRTNIIILEIAHCKVVIGEDTQGVRDPKSERLVCE